MDLQIEEFDSKIREIIPEKAKLEQIATGFGFTEGPIWCGDYLLFSDIPRNRIVHLQIHSYGPEITTFRFPSGNSNGLTLDRSGRLIACEHSTRRVTCTELDGSIRVLADRYQERRLNSPNDVVVRSDGSIFFTDPPFGLRDFHQRKEVLSNGVYRIAPDGDLMLLLNDFNMPNGLAFSPDETILYVDDTAQRHIRAFDVSLDGSISNGRVFIEMKLPEAGVPDGMKVDLQGNVYCTGPGGIWIMEPGGKFLGRILMPELTANFAWGDSDSKTLYITAHNSIYRLRLAAQGI